MTGLEALENISKVDYCFLEGELDGFFGMFSEEYNIIKKELKALEIIKEKGIILQFIKETYTVEQYNAGVFGTLVKPLTQEEYDLLKEVFK